MPRTPRTRQPAGDPSTTDETAAVTAGLEAATATSQTSASRRRGTRRPRAAGAAAEPDAASATIVETTATVADDGVLGAPGIAATRSRRSRGRQSAATTGPASALVGADAASALGASDAAAAPNPRRRSRRPRTGVAAADVTAVVADGEAVAPEASLPAPAVEGTLAGSVVEAPARPVLSAVSQPAPVAPTTSWSTGRRYRIDPDGKVRWLDVAPPSGVAAGPPVDVRETIAATGTEYVTAEAVSEALAPDAPTMTEEPDEAEVAAEELDAVASAVAEVEPSEPALSVEEMPGEDGAEVTDGVEGDGSAPRRRRRSRRGGRGRNRNGATPETVAEVVAELDVTETAVEAVLAPAELPPAESQPAAPLRARAEPSGSALSPLEALMARQNVILDQLTGRLASMARSMETTMTAIENRLKGTDLTRVSAMPRLAVFVDVPNIIYAAERYKVDVDFGKLLDYVSHDRTLIRASAYAPISDDPTQRLELQRFVAPFVSHGYRIVTKPLKRFADGSIKANFDVELAMDILTMSDRLDIVSLVSGDGDFRRLVEIVASRGVRVEVVAFQQSTAAELKAIADSYVDLTLHLNDLCVPMESEPRPRPNRPRIDIG